MAENGTNGTNGSVNYEAIGLALDPKWEGEATSRDFRVKGTDRKFTVRLPIPTNDEQAQKFYACTIADLIKKGVVQRSYDADTPCRNLAEERVTKGEAPEEFANDWLEELREALATEKAPRQRGTAKAASKVGKKVTTLSTTQGLTSDQIMEVMTFADENNVSLREAREQLGY